MEVFQIAITVDQEISTRQPWVLTPARVLYYCIVNLLSSNGHMDTVILYNNECIKLDHIMAHAINIFLFVIPIVYTIEFQTGSVFRHLGCVRSRIQSLSLSDSCPISECKKSKNKLG